DGRLPDQCLELVDVLRHAGADVRVELREAGHARRLSLGRNGRRSSLALAELAARRDRRDLDPSFLAEVLNDAIAVLERLTAVDLRSRDHVDAVTAVQTQRRPRAAGGARGADRKGEAAEREHSDEHDDEDDPESTHIRRSLP